jgi:hypothetical protein
MLIARNVMTFSVGLPITAALATIAKLRGTQSDATPVSEGVDGGAQLRFAPCQPRILCSGLTRRIHIHRSHSHRSDLEKIDRRSRRAEKPLVRIYDASIPKEHERVVPRSRERCVHRGIAEPSRTFAPFQRKRVQRRLQGGLWQRQSRGSWDSRKARTSQAIVGFEPSRHTDLAS